MDKTEFIWMDGKFVKWDDAKIHVLTHTTHYGLGVFEGIRFYKTAEGPAIFRLKEHMHRLYKGAKTAFMKVPFSQEVYTEAVRETVRKNKIEAGYIRPLFIYGYGKMGLDPHGAPVNCSISCWPWGSYLGEEAVKVKISSFIRIHPQSTHADAKICGHYVNSIFASCEAKAAGYQESLLLDYKGNVAEGPGENFYIVKDGKIITPPLGNVLPGITRMSLLQLAKDNGIKVEERLFKPAEVYSADEAFYTGTAAEVTVIQSVDGKEIGSSAPGPITSKLKEQFLDIVHGKLPKYRAWLDYV